MASVPQSKARGKAKPKRADFFFRGEGQRRALDYFRYALEKGRGVFALKGPAGVGKTTIARQVIQEWKAPADAVILLSGERVGGNGVYRQLAAGLGLAHYSLPQPKLLDALERNFSARLSKGGRSLLIVDDADHLQQADLGELSRLCQLQKSGHPLLQVFLIGRRLQFTEGTQRGKSGGIEHLIGSYQLAPLATTDIDDFMQGWAEFEGYKDLPRLPAEMCERVAEWSECLPRKLKRFCEQVRGILAKGRGLAWDVAIVERLIESANSAFFAVQPSPPPVDFTVGSDTGPKLPGPLRMGPVASAGLQPKRETPVPDNSQAVAVTEVLPALEIPKSERSRSASANRAAQRRDAINTPLVAVCATVEEAYVLAPLIKSLAKQIGKCTVLVEPGELNAERPPWSSRSQRVVWRPLGAIAPTEDQQASALIEPLRTGAELLSSGNVKLLISVGNSDNTLGLSLAANKLGVPQVRVEAGRRLGAASKSHSMNQALLERLADCLLVSDSLSQVNLLMEGIQRKRIREIGNLRVDALASLLARDGIELGQAADPKRHGAHGTKSGCALVVLRDERTCKPGHIELLLRVLRDIGEMLPIRLLVSQPLMDALHPSGPVRQWRKWNIDMLALIDPIRSLELLVDARVVVTDTELMQVESTALRVPCITLSDETPWPITVESGGNRLCRFNPVEIIEAVTIALTEPLRRDTVPAMWDGQAAQRATHVLMTLLAEPRSTQ